MALNESRLRNAAKNGYPDFYAEWRTQGQLTTDADLLSSSFDYYKDPNTGKSTTSKKGEGSVGGGNSGPDLGSAPTNTAGWIRTALQTQYGMGREGDFKDREFKTIDSVASIFLNEKNQMKGLGDIAKGFLSDMGMDLMLHFTQQNELLTKMNTQTGMLGELSKGFREEITKASIPAIKLGISFQELSDDVIELVANSGKFKLLGADTIKEMALASKFTDNLKTLAGMAGDFEKAGMGVKDMSIIVEKMGMKSLALGINARSTTKLIDENLKNLNSYGFKGGVEGLNRMAQKSIEFRLNMESVMKVADKVWNPEDALSMAANLQVMGGAFGALNDPIKMMYMATNDVGGLQDAIVGAAKSLATYNVEQGRFEVTGNNLRRAKAMADEFGMSMSDLTTTAVAGMERAQAASDLLSRGLIMKDEDKEFLTNLARMEGGKMVISVPDSLQKQLGGTEVALENMSQEQANALIEQKKLFEAKSMEDIANEQVSLLENINRDLSYIAAAIRVKAGETGNKLSEYLGYDPLDLEKQASKLSKKIVEGGINKLDAENLFKGTKVFRGEQKVNAETGATSANVSNKKKEEEVKKEEPSDYVKRSEVTVNMKTSDVALDPIVRNWNLDYMTRTDKKSFLQSLNQ